MAEETLFVYKAGLQNVPKDVTRVAIDRSVRAIPNIAFKGCKQLKHVEFAKDSQLRVIGSFAFMDCTALEVVELPKTTKRIGCGAFANCIGLKVLIFQEGLEVIGLSAFKGCHGLLYVVIPGTVNLMEPRAFFKCIGLKEVAIKKGLTKIPDLAFDECDSLEKIGIPPSVTSVGQRAIPKGVKEERDDWSFFSICLEGCIENIQNNNTPQQNAIKMPAPSLVSPTQPSQDDSSPAPTQKKHKTVLQLLLDGRINDDRKMGGSLEDKAVQTKSTSTTSSITTDSSANTAPRIAQQNNNNITVPLEQWKGLNARLDALEKNGSESLNKKDIETSVLAQAKQTETTLRKEIQTQVYNLSRTTEIKTAVCKEDQKSMQLELNDIKQKYQCMLNELQQTKEERDDLKQQMHAMKQCLETLKKGVELLVATRDCHYHQANEEQQQQQRSNKRPRSSSMEDEVLSVSSEEVDDDNEIIESPYRPKKRSRTELQQAFSDSLLEIGNISKKIVSKIQWPW